MKNGSLADKVITGFLLILGMAETGHLLMVFGHRPFSDAVVCFLVEAFVLAVGYPAVCLWRKRGQTGGGKGLTGKDITPTLAGIGLIFGLLALYQVITVSQGESIVLKGDQTIETVQSLLEMDGVYTVNPLTGRAYTAGIPNRIKILGLPTFYAILCRIAGTVAGDPLRGSSMCFGLITRWMPVIVLCVTYLVYWTMAKILFPERNDREKRILFLTLTAAVFCVGDYLFGMDGFGLLYCGYRGIVIRNCILVPYTFSLMLRGKWKRALLCVLAEGCIVWTLYGLGACAAVMVGMAVLDVCRKRRIRKSGRNLYVAGTPVKGGRQ